MRRTHLAILFLQKAIPLKNSRTYYAMLYGATLKKKTFRG